MIFFIFIFLYIVKDLPKLCYFYVKQFIDFFFIENIYFYYFISILGFYFIIYLFNKLF